MAYDPLDGYVVLFGGLALVPYGSSYYLLNDTWTFQNGSWTELAPGRAPPPSDQAVAAWDPNASAVVLFGGDNNSTWEFRGGAWSHLPTPVAPPPLLSPSMAYDPKVGGLVLFGGAEVTTVTNASNVTTTLDLPTNFTWFFRNGTWSNATALVGPAPGPRWSAGAAYDPGLGAVVVFGGAPSLAVRDGTLNDTWAFNGSAWRNLTAPVAPPRSMGMALAYVSEDSAIVAFGGENDSYTQPLRETWSFSAGAWSPLAPSAEPDGVWGASFVDDPASGFALLFGGDLWSTEVSAAGGLTNASWTFALGNWTSLGVSSSAPPPGGAEMVYDAADQEALLFSAGPPGSTSPEGVTWVFDGSTWRTVGPPVSPSTRSGEALAYDAQDGYVVLFGGLALTGSPGALNDTWEFLAGNWTQLHPPTAPSARYRAQMADDPAVGGLLLFGGQWAGYDLDTWRFHAGAWTQLHPSRNPTVGAWGPLAIAYDAGDGYAILTASYNTTCPPSALPCFETWAFEAGNWTDLTNLSRPTPPPLLDYALAWDGPDQVVVLFGGRCASPPTCAASGTGPAVSNETWTFSGGNWSNATVAGSPAPRFDAALSNDPADGGALLFGGLLPSANGGATPYSDTWMYQGGQWSQLTPALASNVSATDTGFPVRLSVRGGASLVGASLAYSGLPPGCSSRDVTPLVCAPSAPGRYAVAVNVSFVGSLSASATLSLLVNAPPAIVSFRATESPLEVGNTTTLEVAAQGGTGRLAFAYSGLPPGCPSTDTANLTCRPSGNGTFLVGVAVRDAVGAVARSQLTLNVTPSTAPPSGRGPGTGPGPGAGSGLWGLFGAPVGIGSLAAAGAAVVLALGLWRFRVRRLREEGLELVRGAVEIEEGPHEA